MPSLPMPRFASTHAGRELDHVALPLGGIGTGTLSMGGRGQLRDWEIVNHTAKGFAPKNAFFALSARSGKRTWTPRLLEGALPDAACEGTSGSPVPLAGMPRFARAACRTAYPFLEVALSDPASPCDARIAAYNPFVPGDVDASSWPVAVFEIELENRTGRAIEASVLFGCENFVGTDGIDTLPCRPRNRARRSARLAGVSLGGTGLPAGSELRGDFCLAAERDGGRLTVLPGMARRRWNNDFRELFERFAARGDVRAEGSRGPIHPFGAVCLGRKLAAGRWSFPNRLAWAIDPREERPKVGNHYARRGRDAWAILEKFQAVLPALREKSVRFADAVAGSDLPRPVAEAALANLPALRSQTLFRTADGRFFGYEGGHLNKRAGGTLGSCSHVWGYDLATSFLFPEIARSFRALHFGPAQHPDGAIAFRCGLPLSRALRHPKVAADGQLAAIIGFQRDCGLASDPRWGRALWPRVRRAIRFCWEEGSWDADRDGVMDGCQHNTMDVDYHGPNPLMQGLYVTALRCGAELAARFGDPGLGGVCARLAGAGARYLDRHLFNGDYFFQRTPRSLRGRAIDPRLATGKIVRRGTPDFQVGKGVLIDQMMGGLHARVCGVAEPAAPGKIRTALRAVVRHNFRRSLADEASHMRAFAVGREPGTLMASWPRGGRPKKPFPYYCEVMTGFEHALAAHLLYHGEKTLGLRVLTAIRSRHTGRRRNPFDEAEWGHHYARALASWGSVWAWTGQGYAVGTGELRFRDPERSVVWPWFLGEAWGVVEIGRRGKTFRATVRVHGGSPRIDAVRVGAALAGFRLVRDEA